MDVMPTLFIILALLLPIFNCLPTVDPGVFVLQGVPTCRRGKGYCVLGRTCTVDKDFLPDDEEGNCGELTKSFSSMLSFVCCKYVNEVIEEEVYETTISTVTEMDHRFQILDQNPISIEDVHDMDIPEGENPSNLILIDGVVTDMTGILGLITKPYRPSTTPKPSPGAKIEDEEVNNNLAENYRIDDKIERPEQTISKNEFKILNLPEEIRKYLSTKSYPEQNEVGERFSTSQEIPVTTYAPLDGIIRGEDVKENILDTSTVHVALGKTTLTPSADTGEERDTVVDNVFSTSIDHKIVTSIPTDAKNEYTGETTGIDNSDITTATSINNESDTTTITPIVPTANAVSTTTGSQLWESVIPFTIKMDQPIPTEKPSNLKGSPLVPLNKNRTIAYKLPSTTSEYEITTTEIFANNVSEEQDFHTTYPPHLKSTLLQRYEETEPSPSLTKSTENNVINDIILPHPVNLNICGLKRSNVKVSEVVQTASTYDWCWSAALMHKKRGGDRFECSGTLVEVDLVITTAACLKRLRNEDLSQYRIVLGDSNLKDELPYGVQYHDIEEITTHPDYLTSGGTHANDIGIIRLRDTASLDHNVCLACVSQTSAYIPSHTCVLSGYTLGDVPKDIRREAEIFSPSEGVLRESPVTLEEDSNCRSSVQRMAPNPLIVAHPDAFLCDVKEKSARSCLSTLDGGSPLVCEVGGRWFLAGISSWSRDCTSNPNVYTKVSSFSDWFLNTRLRMYGFITYKV